MARIKGGGDARSAGGPRREEGVLELGRSSGMQEGGGPELQRAGSWVCMDRRASVGRRLARGGGVDGF